MDKLFRIAMVILAVASLAGAQDFEKIAPKQLTPTAPGRTPRDELADQVAPEDPNAPPLKGIVFLADPAQVKKEAAAAAGSDGVAIVGLPLLDAPDFRAEMQSHIGKPMTIRRAEQIMRAVVRHYRRNDRELVRTVVPEQDITSGVLQILVLEGRVGKLGVEGNRYFKSDLYLNNLSFKPGDEVPASVLAGDIDWINRNPFHMATPVLSPGAARGETDITLRVNEINPLRVYGGYENSGNEFTGDHRLFTGVNWGNAFGLDHQFSYQFTVSPDIDQFQSHSVIYTVPLPWRHILTFLGSYAHTESDALAFNNNGETWQASLRYLVPLRTMGNYTHDLTLGFDYKRSNTDLEFGGATVFDSTTDINQWLVGYAGSLRDRWGVTRAGANVFFQPVGITGGADDARYAAVRPGADNEYAYLRLYADRTTYLPGGFEWIIRAEGQITGDNLLGSEQLGVGGSNTVRGYEEREANGDWGHLLSTELRTPAIHIFKLLGQRDSLQGLGFIDYGVAGIHNNLPGQRDDVTLASIGPGVRYSIGPFLSIRYDHGFQLKAPPGEDHKGSRGHISVVVAIPF